MQPNVSVEFPYLSRYATVRNVKMHYVEQGEGDTLLFIHGMPVSSYVWRNIMPAVSQYGRCVAVDLIGMGQSDKPDIAYSIHDHVDYLDGFINTLNLSGKVTIVSHGWGTIIGLSWAMRNPEQVAGLAFCEAHLRPVTNWEMIALPIQQISANIIGSAGADFTDPKAIQQFVKQVINTSVLRKLTDEEMQHYCAPYTTLESFRPIRQYINEFPLGDDPNNVIVRLVSEYSEQLQQSSLPKLLLYAVPGFIMTMDTVMWAKQHLSNLTVADIGEALHFLQESEPENFSRAIIDWLATIRK